jgi:hypothetical protein
MAGLDQATAAKILQVLDADLARRQVAKDKAENERWEVECGGDELIMMARKMSRDHDRPRKEPVASAPTSLEDQECLREDLEAVAKSLLSLADLVERQALQRT